MTEKIGTIKNPLTVIAIFAGIAEVSGTVVLPFISESNQLTFIYFLLTFPSVLVILFFITLNFNNKALYAPSDFNNEENYIKIFKYNISKQENVEVKVSQEELMKILNNNFIDFKNHYEAKFQKFESDLKILKELTAQKAKVSNEAIIEEEEIIDEYEDYDYEEFELEGLVSINNFPKVNLLNKMIMKKGYPTEIYSENSDKVTDYQNNKSIWLGYKVPFEQAKEIILLAKEYLPHLSYIDYSNNISKPPHYVHYQIFIGGSTKTAKERGVKALTQKDWETLKSINKSEEFEKFIKSFQ